LFLIGEAGSGKSKTLEHVIQPIFSRRSDGVIAASQMSAFALMKQTATSNILPLALDEFKPTTLDKSKVNILYSHFRDSYDGHEGVRGTQSQSVKTYQLLAPLVVAGEESPNETAIRERTIELLFSKKDIKNQAYRAAFRTLHENHTNALKAFGRSLLDVALQTVPSEVEGWFAEGERRFNEDFPSRVVSNLACGYAGLMLVRKLCGGLGLSWDGTFPLPIDACCAQMFYAAREYLLDGGAHNQSIVEHTFEVLARMNLKCDKDYTFKAGGKHLWIRFGNNLYDRYTKYRKDHAVVGEVLTDRQFLKQLEHTEYCLEKNKTERIGGKPCKIWIIDFEKLSNACNVSGFLTVQDDEQV
jgi:hypothetical protein